MYEYLTYLSGYIILFIEYKNWFISLYVDNASFPPNIVLKYLNN